VQPERAAGKHKFRAGAVPFTVQLNNIGALRGHDAETGDFHKERGGSFEGDDEGFFVDSFYAQLVKIHFARIDSVEI
jgi:hypothetical protein